MIKMSIKYLKKLTTRTFKHYMHVCGFNLIKFGPDQKIHMYGVDNSKALREESKLILKKVEQEKSKIEL
jgi:hypothetical protein